jgi:metal-dependent amidase/aminoacylase/carboxypeptidase family protein
MERAKTDSRRDALMGLGHACGHNLIAISSVGAALATAEVMMKRELGGKVVLFGTPAEGKNTLVVSTEEKADSNVAEGGGGKIRLLDGGAYSDHKVDISLIAHPGVTPDAALVRTAAYAGMKVEYFGKEAHAAARPWEGVRYSFDLVQLPGMTDAYRSTPLTP